MARSRSPACVVALIAGAAHTTEASAAARSSSLLAAVVHFAFRRPQWIRPTASTKVDRMKSLLLAAMLLTAVNPSVAQAATFKGYQCDTSDCRGHIAGYNW